jgi:hypothetical protein
MAQEVAEVNLDLCSRNGAHQFFSARCSLYPQVFRWPPAWLRKMCARMQTHARCSIHYVFGGAASTHGLNTLTRALT